MKNITTFIKESQFTMESINKDWTIIDNLPSANDKKTIAAKYGIDSKKVADIKMGMSRKARDIRKTKKSFDNEDYKWFMRLDIPSQYKKLVPVLDEESIDFVIFLKDYYEKRVKSIKLRNGRTLFDVKDTKFGRDWNYYMSRADKYVLDTYLNYCQYLNEKDPSEIKNKADQNNIEASIKAIMMADMKEFHDDYIERIKEFATKYWDALPELIKSAKEKVERTKKTYYAADSKSCKYYNSRGLDKNWTREKYNELYEESKDLKKKYEKAASDLKRLEAVQKRYGTKSNYIKECEKDAEAKFNANVDAIVERIKKQDFVIANLKVTDVKHDPKFFEMVVTDGDKKVFCRSVYAAQYSIKMIPHFRFIITNRK